MAPRIGEHQKIYRSTDQGNVRAVELALEANDTLSPSPPLLPGFQMPLAELLTEVGLG